jgi:hypothetical protein
MERAEVQVTHLAHSPPMKATERLNTIKEGDDHDI